MQVMHIKDIKDLLGRPMGVRYLQGFGHLQGQATLHVDCTTNVHLGGAVHVLSYPDLII